MRPNTQNICPFVCLFAPKCVRTVKMSVRLFVRNVSEQFQMLSVDTTFTPVLPEGRAKAGVAGQFASFHENTTYTL